MQFIVEIENDPALNGAFSLLLVSYEGCYLLKGSLAGKDMMAEKPVSVSLKVWKIS